MIPKHQSGSTRQRSLLAATSIVFMLLGGCSDNSNTTTTQWDGVEGGPVYVETVPKEFFTGWWEASGESVYIDLAAGEFRSSAYGADVIEECIAIDHGYALHRFIQPRQESPEGLHDVMVVRKEGADRIFVWYNGQIACEYIRRAD